MEIGDIFGTFRLHYVPADLCLSKMLAPKFYYINFKRYSSERTVDDVAASKSTSFIDARKGGRWRKFQFIINKKGVKV